MENNETITIREMKMFLSNIGIKEDSIIVKELLEIIKAWKESQVIMQNTKSFTAKNAADSANISGGEIKREELPEYIRYDVSNVREKCITNEICKILEAEKVNLVEFEDMVHLIEKIFRHESHFRCIDGLRK